MCLGVPGQILEIRKNEAVVDFWGVQRNVRLDQLEGAPALGEYIIEHAGYAVRLIPVEDVADTLALYEIVLADACDDPQCEIAFEFEKPALV